MSGVADDADGALVLYSGGQDSTTCLAWALTQFARVETIGFDYGQRHRVDLDCRTRAAAALRAMRGEFRERLGEDHLIDLSAFGALSRTAMTEAVAIERDARGMPNTFVPGRNLVFLQFAAAVGHGRGLRHLIGGMCEADNSGYPDCRRDTLDAMRIALNLGMDADFVIHTPLIERDKAGVWALAQDLGGERFVGLIVEETHTCYLGERGTRHAWGYGCGTCPACELRARGYERFREQQQEEESA